MKVKFLIEKDDLDILKEGIQKKYPEFKNWKAVKVINTNHGIAVVMEYQGETKIVEKTTIPCSETYKKQIDPKREDVIGAIKEMGKGTLREIIKKIYGREFKSNTSEYSKINGILNAIQYSHDNPLHTKAIVEGGVRKFIYSLDEIKEKPISPGKQRVEDAKKLMKEEGLTPEQAYDKVWEPNPDRRGVIMRGGFALNRLRKYKEELSPPEDEQPQETESDPPGEESYPLGGNQEPPGEEAADEDIKTEDDEVISPPEDEFSGPYQEHNMLRTIEKMGPCSASMIVIETGMDRETVMKILDKLEKQSRISSEQRGTSVLYKIGHAHGRS